MTISDKHVVAISYYLTIPSQDGTEEFVEQTPENNPFVFLYGSSGLLPAFERALYGKALGERFDFIISAEEGYGKHEAENVVSIPRGAFLDEQGNFDSEMIAVGKMIPMSDNEGNRMMGKVLVVDSEQVQMDFNHTLADKALHFMGEVLQIRPATADELSHGHAHGMDGHAHHH